MAKATGGSGSIVVNSITIDFNTIDVAVEKEFDESSDSANYDQTTQIVHKEQLPVATQTTIDVAGKVNLAYVPAVLVAMMYSGIPAVPCVIKWTGTSTFGHGLVDVTNFKGTIDAMKVLNFTATLLSHGIFVPNA